MPLSKNQEIKLHIDSVSSEGSGVGRFDGQAVFVSGAAVGDELSVHIIKAKKTYAVGKIKEIIKPSKDRIAIDCPYFKQCGGCVYRHMGYDAEKRIKTQKIKDAFLRLAHIDVPVREIITANTERYRNKAEYPVGRDLNGVNIGFYANHSHRIVDAEDCLLQPEEFAEIAAVIRKWIFDNHISVWNSETGDGLLRHIYIRKGFLSGEIMVCLVVNGENVPKAEELMSAVSKISGVKSIVLNINTKNTNVILGEKVKVLWGSEKISDTLCGVEIELSPLSFYQVNHDGAEALYKKAAEYAALSGEETVIDLYCGAGTIGLSMANKAKKIIGVEIIPEAIEDAKKNAERNGIRNCEFYCMDASEAVKMLRDKNIQPDVILLDPPRKGCSKAVLECAAQMNPQRIVYISCDVSTQSRDCAILKDLGYITQEVTPVDMFPRTAHVECVACLNQKKTADSDTKKYAFFENARLLSETMGIVPLMYGSLGLEYLTGKSLNADDIDILIPEVFITEKWNEFKNVLEKNGYVLIDESEHTFDKNGIHYSYAGIEELEFFADICISDISELRQENICFKLLSLEQYLKVYTASAKDGYRTEVRNKKDSDKIKFIQEQLL